MSPLLAALLLASAPAPCGAPAERSAEAARFAEWLFARGDYYRAIGEWERALFLDPADPAAGRHRLRIAAAYAAGGKPDASVSVLRSLVAGEGAPAVRDEALFEIGRVRYRAHQAEAAVAALEPYTRLAAPSGGPGTEAARLLLSMALARTGDRGRARLALDPVAADGPLANEAGALRATLLELEGVPRKSPAAAGILSALLPGLGHAYAGDLAGAAGALALNGLFVWATVDAFRDRRYGLGALLLVGESIWYGGAVYGAVAEAMRFNRDARRAALARMDARFGWVLEPVRGGATIGIRGPLDPGSPPGAPPADGTR